MGRCLFTTGAAMLILLGLVHSLSLFQTPAASNETERQLLDLMANYKFDLMGSMHSMAELQRGFSVAFMLAAIGLGALDLLLRRERTGLLKRIALINTTWLAAMTANSLPIFRRAQLISGNHPADFHPVVAEAARRRRDLKLPRAG